jgi:hypothetical protein
MGSVAGGDKARRGANPGEKMRKLDLGLAGLLVMLGFVHNFVAAPMSYQSLTTQALWFLSAGLALWYAGFINLLRAEASDGGRLLAWLCVVTNVSLLIFVVAFAAVRGNWTAPEAWLLAGTVALLTGSSVASLLRKG